MGTNIAVIFACLAILSFHVWTSTGSHHNTRRGILRRRCNTSIFTWASIYCRAVRGKELQIKKGFFKISCPESRYGFLHLDQPHTRTLSYFFTEKFHSHWFNLYFNLMLKRVNTIIVPYLKMKYKGASFNSYENYTQIAKEMKDVVMGATRPLPQFKYPSRSYEYFIDLLVNERFKRDDYFAQQRLAGLNPMAIRRVVHQGAIGTKIGELLSRLNTKNFDWDTAVVSITKDRNMYESIYKKKVYVVEFPMLNNLTTMPDLLFNDRPNGKMKKHVSPIALFAVDPQKNLKVVAIQNSSYPDGHVHTPRDGILWNISKAQLQTSDGFVAQVQEHLMKTHFRMEPVCIALHRHLSAYHPLHQILKYHCRGLLPLNAQGFVTLLREVRTLRSLFAYGNEGAIQLLRKEYPKMVWGDIDLEVNVEERGMDDKDQVPYYPYRDDGRIISQGLDVFAIRLVNVLYNRDFIVLKDSELQNMIQELSEKVKGFPSVIKTKQQLSKLIRQILWILVQHSAFSFPIAEHGQSPVLFPTKFYEPSKPKNPGDFIQMLPGHNAAILQASLVSGLGTLHYDSLFDYWNELTSPELRTLVENTYDHMRHIQTFIHNENKKRFQKKQLTNPFMLPDWMPNSIST